jgi:polyhydroxyalkanoate synthesis regulator phasin
MERQITRNKDGTFKVVESNVVESVTKDNLVLFRDKLKEDITRLEKNVADLKKQEKEVAELLKE